MENINHRITSSGYLESDFIYPKLNEWKRVCKVDSDWFKSKISEIYGAKKLNNKYVCKIDGRYYYNHDGDIHLIEEVNKSIKGLKK